MFKLTKNGHYLVAVSGGADSMALLDMLRCQNYQITVCHINYKQRQSAYRDYQIVKQYCTNHNIALAYFEFNEPPKNNFQDQARKFRYLKFNQVINENKLRGVIVGHHLDDLIETYYIQKQRNITPDYYGLQESVKIFGINVFRVLLDYQKTDLEKYCLEHNIIFGLDESNLSNKYLRNKLRNTDLSKLSYEDKQVILQEIKQLNKQNLALKVKYQTLVKKDVFECCDFFKIENLDLFLRLKLTKSLSAKYISEIIKQLKQCESLYLTIGNKTLIRNYNFIKFTQNSNSYCYYIDSPKYLKTAYFELVKQGKNIDKFSVDDRDFPLTIRNFNNGDKIKMAYGHKKISRFFIDRKIDLDLRKIWPVVVNSQNEIIFVLGLGCNYDHFKLKYDFFMIKCKG